MTELYKVDSPITREQRNNINATFEDILKRFNNLRYQISILAGGEDLEAILQTIEDAVTNANNTTANTQQTLNDISSALSQLEEALNNNNNATENVQNIINNLESFDYDPNANYNFPSFVSYEGNTYIVLSEVSGVTPTDDKVNYRLAARRGIDGVGSVASVNNKAPDTDGNLELTPNDIGSPTIQNFSELNDKVNSIDIDLNNLEDESISFNKSSDLLTYATNNSFLPLDSFDEIIKNVGITREFKVAFVGDSITKGADQVSYYDTFAAYFEREIRKNSKDLELSFFNFGIGSTGIRNFLNNDFVGGTNFNENWSTEGVSWNQAVRDFNPDLLIVGFGMNDTSMNSSENYNSYSELLTLINSWEKTPKLTLIPTILPTTNEQLYNQSQERTLAIARSTRQFAIDNNIPLIDANRFFVLLRDGRDVLQQTSNIERNFFGYPSQWSGNFGSFSLSDNVLSPLNNASGAFVTRERDYYNGVIEAEVLFEQTGIGNAFWVNFRNSANYGRLTLLVVSRPNNAGYVELYTGGSSTGLVNKLNIDIEPGVYHKIKIESIENRHIISVNGVVAIDYKTPLNMYVGKVSIGSEGAVPTIRNFNITYREDIQSQPYYTESDLLGQPNSPESGNGINHPSGLGYYLIYSLAAKNFLNKLLGDLEYAKNFSLDGGTLDPNADFNNLTRSKVYQVGSVLNNGNSPGESWGVLEVISPLNTNYVTQKFTGVLTGNTYLRARNANLWTSWKLLG